MTNIVGRLDTFGTSQCSDRSIACCIYHLPSAIGTYLPPHVRAFNGCYLFIQLQFHTSFTQHLFCQAGINIGIYLYTTFHPLVMFLLGKVGQGSPSYRHSTGYQIPNRPCNHLLSPGMEKSHIGHFGLNRRSAYSEIALHKQGTCTGLCRGKSSPNSRRTAPHNNDIIHLLLLSKRNQTLHNQNRHHPKTGHAVLYLQVIHKAIFIQ